MSHDRDTVEALKKLMGVGDPEADATRSRQLRDALTQVPKHIQAEYDRATERSNPGNQ